MEGCSSSGGLELGGGPVSTRTSGRCGKEGRAMLVGRLAANSKRPRLSLGAGARQTGRPVGGLGQSERRRCGGRRAVARGSGKGKA